jgi:hypothetical protein
MNNNDLQPPLETNNFEIITSMRSEINRIFGEIDNKLKILNALHTDLVKTHLDSNYRFGLDSFHFQNRLIQIENDNMKSLFCYIDNRIYCEYYKLYRIICEYISSGLNDKNFSDKLVALHKKFPIYKDLEPTKIYDFNITHEISSSINYYISELQTYINLKKQELAVEQTKANSGINIHNLINEHEYKISLLEEKTNMFLRYLNTFHIHHTKYFDRLTSKLRLTNTIVNEDINLKQNSSLQMKPQHKAYVDTLPHHASIPELESEPATASMHMIYTVPEQIPDGLPIIDNTHIKLNTVTKSPRELITLNIEEIGASNIFISDV